MPDKKKPKDSKLLRKYMRNLTSLISVNGTYTNLENSSKVDFNTPFAYLENKDSITIFSDGVKIKNKNSLTGNRIHRYLHSSRTFENVQTKILNIQNGVFTYLNPLTNKFIFLYGGDEDFKDSSKIKPSFLFKHYAFNKKAFSKKWVDIDNQDPDKKPFYRFYNRLHHAIREHQLWSNSKTVKFFNFEIKNKEVIKGNATICQHNSLLHFQLKNQVLYIPSGEIDCKVLAGLFLDQRESITEQLKAGVKLMDVKIIPPTVQLAKNTKSHELVDFTFLSSANSKIESDNQINKGLIKPKYEFEGRKIVVYFKKKDYSKSDEKGITYYHSPKKTIKKLLYDFGLIDTDTNSSLLTERGEQVIKWLNHTLCSEPQSNYLFIPLKKESKYILPKFPKINNIDLAISHIWDWINLSNESSHLFSDFEAFEKSTVSMIDLITHFFVRSRFIDCQETISGAKEFLQKEIATNIYSVGWCAFPILYSSTIYEDSEIIKNKVAGLFIGNFRDLNSKGENYFIDGISQEHYNSRTKKYTDNKSSTIEFKDLVSRWKMVIMYLAHFENGEVMYKKIAQSELLYEATKSHVANIFIRNIAHNIGSHVITRSEISKIYQKLGIQYDNILDLLSGQKLASILNNTVNESDFRSNILEYYSEVRNYVKKSIYITSLRKILDKYLSERQEFISDISPEAFPMNSKCYFYKDIVLPFVENLLLIGNIAQSEGIGFINHDSNCSLQIRFFRNYGVEEDNAHKELMAVYTSELDNGETKKYYYPNHIKGNDFPFYIDLPDGQKVGYKDSMKYEDFVKDKEIIAYDISNTLSDKADDVEIAIPSHLGKHALYSILENIIRNSAKNHVDIIKNRKDIKLTIFISIDDDKYTSQSRIDKVKENVILKDYYNIRIWDDVTTIDIKKIRPEKNKIENEAYWYNVFEKRVTKPPIQSNNITKKTLGLDDIRISALILGGGLTKFGMKAFLADSPENRYLHVRPRIKMLQPTNENEFFFFYYEFRLAKPCDILFIASSNLRSKFPKDSLRDIGIVLAERLTDFNGTYKSDFCLINWEKVKNIPVQEICSQFFYLYPNRIIFYNIPEVCNELKDLIKFKISNTKENLEEVLIHENVNALIVKCWKIWLSRWGIKKASPIHIYSSYSNFSENYIATFFENEIIDWKVTNYNLEEDRQVMNANLTQEYKVIFDRHGADIHPKINNYEEVFHLNGKCFYQRFEKNSIDLNLLNNLPDSLYQREILGYRMAEAGLLKILVMDERISEIAAQPSSCQNFTTYFKKGVTNFEMLLFQNIYVCTELNVNSKPVMLSNTLLENRYILDGLIKKTNDYEIQVETRCTLNSKILELPNEFDVLLIHRTKLNEIISILAMDEAIIIGELRKYFPLIVVNSGGGAKGILGFKTNYFNHSITTKFFQDNFFSKIAFTEKIMG